MVKQQGHKRVSCKGRAFIVNAGLRKKVEIKNKGATKEEYARIMKSASLPNADSDGDGVKNCKDKKPLNPNED